MRISGLWLGLLAASLVSASAQVTAEIVLGQQQYLPGESMPIAVRITNRSGQTLNLGSEPDWLTFSINTPEGMIVPQVGEVPVQGEFTLGSSKVATKRVDIAPYFSAIQPGRYELCATIRIRDWDREIISETVKFNVIQGSKLWEQEVGVPRAADAGNGAPELRKYMLQQANYIKGQIRLYARVTDSYGRTYKVLTLGKMLSFSRPEPQVDKFSNLHVLYQDGPYSFSYTVCNLVGEVIVRHSYDYVNSKPRLRADEDGNISVVGGARRVTRYDIPPPKEDDSESDASQPSTSSSAAPESGASTNTVKAAK
ncbi:MAG TPA: hypothetical protein VEC99_05850 [Clostridia bacterium]|nr:hypothetical protein [Clostridia bacterium]